MIEVKYGKRKVVSYRGNKMVVGGLTAKNKIDILLYISTEFANSNSREELYSLVLTLSEEIFEVDNVTLRLWDGKLLRPERYLQETDPPRRPLKEHEGFSGRVLAQQRSELIHDLSLHPELLDEGETTRCVCCVPVMYKENVLGTISIEKDIPSFYKEDDLEILEAMASQLALALNQMSLISGLIEAQDRINSDLKMGRSVQGHIISSEVAPWNGIHFGFYYEPMVEVSGDYFDVIRKGNHITLLVADVSGHGVSAALVTMTIHHEFRRCIAQGMGLPEIMEYLGESIRPKLPAETYFTAQIVRIYNDLSFSFVNAGHNRLLVFDGESASFMHMDAAGMPLGIVESRRQDYEERFGKLRPGDMLIMFTDGIPEQRDAKGQDTTLERFLYWIHTERDKLVEYAGKDTQKLCDNVIEQWKRHVDGMPRSDDITVLMASCCPELDNAMNSFRQARKSTKEENRNRAITYALKAYEMEPSLHENLKLLSKLHYEDEDYTAAADYLARYIEVSGDANPQVYYTLGNIHFKSNQIANAKREFKRSLSLDYTFTRSSVMLARCYVRGGEIAKAMNTLKRSLKSTPGNEMLRESLATVERVAQERGEPVGFPGNGD